MTDATGLIFTGEAVTKGADNAWTYINTQYWTAGKEYWFSAIALTTDAQWTYAVNSKVEGGIITFENGDGTQDLLYAYSGKVSCTTPAEQGAVSFTFNHLLSRVKFNFTNSMGNDNITLKVTEVLQPRHGHLQPTTWQAIWHSAPYWRLMPRLQMQVAVLPTTSI